ncbi:MAG: cell division protein FtsQ/DivIB [Lachnospiraceae bacterium]|nr:cell division protein FtsQ/DivIB [Lachnospiraceae bacterium]
MKTDFALQKSIHKKIAICIALGLLLAAVIIINVLLEKYRITTVYVEGNEHYTAAQIRSFVETGKFGDNSIYLSMKYRNKSITDIPFIEKMDVDVWDKNTIKITVYEKALAGYVEYLDKYMYFDREGIVVESSSLKTPGIPLVTGLSFDHFLMNEPLPVENEKIFQTILSVTQLLNKYEIVTDRIYFDSHYEMTLYFGKVRVALGDDRLIEEKIQRLSAILPLLKGKQGVLNMKTYQTGDEDLKFVVD